MNSNGSFEWKILIFNFKLFGPEYHLVAATGWHRCSFSSYLLSHILNNISRSCVLTFSRTAKPRSLLNVSAASDSAYGISSLTWQPEQSLEYVSRSLTTVVA